MDISAGNHTISNLGKINIVLGKNGCGKSTLLKQVEMALAGQGETGLTKYITPERGGVLTYEANIEQNVTANADWLPSTRRVNQFTQFRQQTVVQYRRLELRVLRELEHRVFKDQIKDVAKLRSYEAIIDQINNLLDNVIVSRGQGPVFNIEHRGSGQTLTGADISSGEAELISLAIECLTFSSELIDGKQNVLFIDEPDVHLHPDLQARLTQFMKALVEEHKFILIMATHSTAMLGELADYDGATVALMKSGDKDLRFTPIDSIYRQILPVFGAHPLSNVFNEGPILLLEGEDDVRIWQQAIRTSEGRIKLYPVECGGLPYLSSYEDRVKQIVNAVYDNARAFSLRDRDEVVGAIEDDLPLIRMRLNCRAAENLLLTDEVLKAAHTSWSDVQVKVEAWIAAMPDHPKHSDMLAFKNNGFNRKSSDLKEVRMLLVGDMIASSKPWEVLVGQAIGKLQLGVGPGSLREYLGEKVVKNLVP